MSDGLGLRTVSEGLKKSLRTLSDGLKKPLYAVFPLTVDLLFVAHLLRRSCSHILAAEVKFLYFDPNSGKSANYYYVKL